jgi:hypothetical protein
MKYSKGIMWLDDTRIPFVDGIENEFSSTYLKSGYSKEDDGGDVMNISGGKRQGVYVDTKGRFTPNLLVCDDMLNDGIEHKSGKVKPHHKRNKTMGEYQGNAYGKFNNISPDLNYDAYYGDKGSNSRYYDLDLWFDKMLERL